MSAFATFVPVRGASRRALALRRLLAGLATASILGSLLAVAPVAPVALTVRAAAIDAPLAEVLTQQAYVKATDPSANDYFGQVVAISGDTMVVGAYEEDSGWSGVDNTSGTNPDREALTISRAGAAYVYVRSGGTWLQQAYLKAADPMAWDAFGSSVAISGDTIVVGAPGESSSVAGVENTSGTSESQELGDLYDSGAAYVFVRVGGTWSQQAYLKASNPGAYDKFGTSVAISGDTILVGAPQEASSARGPETTGGTSVGQELDDAAQSGAAYVFVRSGGLWSQQAYLKASNTDPNDQFGERVAISGETAVVASTREDSAAAGVENTAGSSTSQEDDELFSSTGAAYVFARTGGTWAQEAYLKASTPGDSDQFGYDIAISGNTIVVGAIYEDSTFAGVENTAGSSENQGDEPDLFQNVGAAYVFVRGGAGWAQQAYLKASDPQAYDTFGSSVAIDGDTVVVGATGEASEFAGVEATSGSSPNQENAGRPASGAAYLFTRNGGQWAQRAYLKASNPGNYDAFGTSIGIAGRTIVAGAPLEDSGFAGVENTSGSSPNQADGRGESGAAYVFAAPSAGAYVVGKGTGTCADHGSIQAAVNAASSGDIVHVCAGTYDISSSGTISTAGKSLTFEGDGAASTVVDGGGAVQLFTTTGPGPQGDITLRGLTLRNGWSLSNPGGAVNGQYVRIESVVFRNNASAESGGAVRGNYDVAVTDGTFIDNTGGVSWPGNSGGALVSRFGGVRVERSRFVGNSILRETADGGAISGGAVTIIDSSFVGNSAPGSGAKGGALSAFGDLAIVDSTFAGNEAGDYGGAAHAWNARTIHATNSTFADNTSGAEAGALSTSGVVDLRNLTLLRNVGRGGIGAVKASSASIANTILGAATDRCQISTLTDLGGNLAVTDGSTSSGCISADQTTSTELTSATSLDLQALADYGGPTRTIALGASSVALDYGDGTTGSGGDPATLICTESADPWSVAGVDQRGVIRPYGAGCDSGAYEVGAPDPGVYIEGKEIHPSEPCSDYATIQAAVSAAADGDVIHVCQGTYALSTAIVTGFGVTLTFRGDGSANTTIDGQGRTQLLVALESVKLRDLTLSNGDANAGNCGSISFCSSGGVSAFGDVAAERVRFSGNLGFTDAYGGAVYAFGTVSVTDGTFTGNAVPGAGDGGAIAANGSVTIDGAAFVENTAGSDGAGDAYGGAIASAGSVSITDGTFERNSAVSYGGAIAAGVVEVSDGTFVDGSAGVSGGAIYTPRTVDEGYVVVDGTSRFSGNRAGWSGGAIAGYADATSGSIYGDALFSVQIHGTATFEENTAGTDATAGIGGAIFASSRAYVGDGEDPGTAIAFERNRATGSSSSIATDPVSGRDESTGTGGAVAISSSTGDDTEPLGGSLQAAFTTFTGNRAPSGGAVAAPIVLSLASTFSGNVATDAVTGTGGAVRTGWLVALASTFSGNAAVTGGAVEVTGTSYTVGRLFGSLVVSSTLDHNRATGNGSAVRAAGPLSVTNSTIVDGSAGTGGVGDGALAAATDGSFALTNVTFARNTGASGVGAVVGDATTANTIFGSPSDGCAGVVTDLGGNIAVTDGSGGCIASARSRTIGSGGLLQLGALADNGGLTRTVAIGDASVAIGYGRGTTDGTEAGDPLCLDNGSLLGVNGLDQRGEARPQPASTDCDSGAFENTTGTGPTPLPTTTVTRVSSATVTPADAFFDTAVVSGTSGDGNGGRIDPTGEVRFYVCFSATAASDCDWEADSSTFDELGDPVDLTAGSSATDGTSGTATSETIDSSHPLYQGEGWYVFHASYSSGDADIYEGSEDDGTNETVRVRTIAVVIAYTGPVIVYTSGDAATVTLTAQVTPNTHACPVTFTALSDGTTVATPPTVWTVANGIATSAPIRLPLGTYEIVVATSAPSNPCSGAPDYTGVLSIVPSTIPAGKGGTGGGWYSADATPPKVGFGYVVQVNSTTSKVGKTTVTTTRTKGQLIWVAKSAGGWRLKGTLDYSSTDGSTAWAIRTDCDPTTGSALTRCATFSGTGVLQRLVDGVWTTSTYGRVSFVVRAYDGGTTSICKGSGKTKSCTTADLADYFGITMRYSTGSGTALIPSSSGVPVNAFGTATAWYLVRQGSLKTY